MFNPHTQDISTIALCGTWPQVFQQVIGKHKALHIVDMQSCAPCTADFSLCFSQSTNSISIYSLRQSLSTKLLVKDNTLTFSFCYALLEGLTHPFPIGVALNDIEQLLDLGENQFSLIEVGNSGPPNVNSRGGLLVMSRNNSVAASQALIKQAKRACSDYFVAMFGSTGGYQAIQLMVD